MTSLLSLPHRGPVDLETFGRRLFETEDLDPLYVAIVGSGLRWDVLHRFALAYLCFYDVGSAAVCADSSGATFWREMELRAKTPASRRGAERRHFRGKLAIDSVAALREGYGDAPENFVGAISHVGSTANHGAGSFSAARRRVEGHVGFGPWISFKAADLVERCFAPGAFVATLDEPLPDSPREALEALGASLLDVVRVFDGTPAPPTRDGDASRNRGAWVQEAETVLCKYASKRYEIGKDIHEIRHSLERVVETSPTARGLYAAMPPEVK
jgi:hypothetical protein